jgi:hypothetical protein
MAYWQWGNLTMPMWLSVIRAVKTGVGILMSLRGSSAPGRVLANGIRVVCPDVVGRGENGLTDPALYQIPICGRHAGLAGATPCPSAHDYP